MTYAGWEIALLIVSVPLAFLLLAGGVAVFYSVYDEIRRLRK